MAMRASATARSPSFSSPDPKRGSNRSMPIRIMKVMSSSAKNMPRKCRLPADHMAEVLDLPFSRACLAMPMAPAAKKASTRAIRTKTARMAEAICKISLLCRLARCSSI